jgi:hypothetical protein
MGAGALPATKQPEQMNRMIWLIGLLGVCAGCGPQERPAGQLPDPGDVAEGSFEATVQGTDAYTLEGAATFRLDARGRLTGVELDGAAPADGVSFELEAAPLAPRRYLAAAQAATEGDGGTLRFAGYLDHDGRSYASVDGLLQLTEVEPALLHGAFEVRLQSLPDDGDPDPPEVILTGAFQATPGAP